MRGGGSGGSEESRQTEDRVEAPVAERRTVRRHPDAPAAVRWLVRTLEEAGFETWAVGGAVRDVLLGVDSVDWDFATRARPGEIRKVFRRTVPIGIEHGTVGVLARDGTLYEVTTFRKDVETTGRHAVVEFADDLHEDLGRRDFTINAVAWHPLQDELFDPFGGVADMERGVLRTVGRPERRFSEDYLRILRGLRFAGRFDLSVDPATWRALTGGVERLGDLSPERLREELVKVLLKDERPSGALALYAASGALERVHPELAALTDLDASHLPPSTDAWAFACLAADALPSSRPLLRLAVLLMDAGVPERIPGQGGGMATPADVAERGRRRAAAHMTRLRFSNAEVGRVADLVAGGTRAPPVDGSGPELRRWLARVGPEHVPDLVRLWGARARVREAMGGAPGVERVVTLSRRLRSELAARRPLSVGALALDGRDLIRMGLKPGPDFGRILEDLLGRVLEDPELNRTELLERIVREEWLEGEPDSP